MGDEIDDKATAISKLAVRLPSYKKTYAYLFAFSFIAGFLLRFALSPHLSLSRLSDSLLYGGAEGLLFLGIPALLASVLAASLARKEDFRHRLKHFSVISLASTALVSLAYLLALVFAPPELRFIVLLANSLVFLVWFAALFVMLNYGPKSVLMAALHPVFNLSFLVIWSSFLLPASSDPLALLFKFALSSIVLLLAFASIFYILNAPAKRNFGISTLQTATLFFAQLVYGKKDIEDIFGEMGENAETFLGTVAFRKPGGKLKALFLVPHMHFGPFGNVGGSEFPFLIAQDVQEKLKCPAFVFHGTANHDLNPIYSFTSTRIANEFAQSALGLKKSDYSAHASFVNASYRHAKALGLSFEKKSALLALTRAPETTDDIALPLGISLAEKLKAGGFKEAILVDMHNTKGDEPKMAGGSADYFEFYDLFAGLKPAARGEPFKLGTAIDSLSDFTPAEGIGKGGLKVAVFHVGRKRFCYLLFDANNLQPEFRRHVLLRVLSKHHFDACDLLTTDTHAVNSFSSVHNPLGAKINWEKLTSRIEKAISVAVGNLEPVEAAVANKRISLEVLGSGRTSELLTTVSALVAIAKIFAPILFLASLLLALMLLHL